MGYIGTSPPVLHRVGFSHVRNPDIIRRAGFNHRLDVYPPRTKDAPYYLKRQIVSRPTECRNAAGRFNTMVWLTIAFLLPMRVWAGLFFLSGVG